MSDGPQPATGGGRSKAPEAPGPTRAAVRPAATVIVLRPRAGEHPELYMLRRSSESPFMPDALVFPGGRVDKEDAHGGSIYDDQAFARAAQRECLEEANLSVEPAALRCFDTWTTPSGESPRRFLARFFITQISADAGHEAQADGHETSAGRWATAPELLGSWGEEKVDLPPPTLSILLRLADGDWRAWLERDMETAREAILPKISPSKSELCLLMPHDPDYAAAPGDAGGVPERVRVYPRRFVREGKRWIPHFD